jgi:uncharacterized protein YwgA
MKVANQDILYMIANKHNFDLKRTNMIDRLILQKTIYLLQAYGLQLGYGFSWYTYGPYSQDLVNDSFTVLKSEKGKYEERTSSLSFSKETIKKFNDFKHLLKGVLGNARKLELVASVDFVRKTWHPDVTRENIAEVFGIRKVRYYDRTEIKAEEVESAFDLCDKIREQ